MKRIGVQVTAYGKFVKANGIKGLVAYIRILKK